MQKLVIQLENLCAEAKELQKKLQQGMLDRTRADQQDRGRQPARRSTTRKGR